MATRFYFPSTGAAAVSPAFDSDWENTDDATRLRCVTTRASTTMTSIQYRDASATNEDHLIRQWVSDAVDAQSINASQSLTFQMRVLELGGGENQFVTIGVRVFSNDGATERGVVLAVTRDGTEAATTLTNRSMAETGSAVEAQANDRIVIEIGTGGDPAGGNDHNMDIRIGDNDATDLPQDDTTTNDNNPWLRFSTTITFVAGPVVQPPFRHPALRQPLIRF